MDVKKLDWQRPKAKNNESSTWTVQEKIELKNRYQYTDVELKELFTSGAGIPPFLRGPYSTMYVNQAWTIRQYAGFSNAKDSNAFYRKNLAAGQKGLSIAFEIGRAHV